ncbi:Brassinosteroid-responsive RING protein 1 [Linum grandiflorum]
MGFPIAYTEVFMPKIFVHALSFLGILRTAIVSLFTVLGLSDFIETAADNIWPNGGGGESDSPSSSAACVGGADPGDPADNKVRGAGG